MTVAIERDVPMPDKRRHGRKSKYPWGDMEVGDSFLVIGRDKKLPVPKHLKPRKFEQRFIEGGVRVWRTA